VPFPSPLHDRTFARCETLNYREWAGYYAVSAYEAHHEHEYFAIRHAAGMLDISPLFKYLVTGRDAARLVDRVTTRSAMQMQPGQVIYTPWCDEDGWIIDDGTIARLAEDRFRWTAAQPNLRWLTTNSRGLDVQIADVSERTAAIALQGPTSAAVLREACDIDIAGLKYFHVASGQLAAKDVEISRTGYTGDLGYEIWMQAGDAPAVWDALMAAGGDHGVTPAGLLALDVARIEAGLLLIDVDFISVRKAFAASQRYSPLEMSLERLIDFGKERFIGRVALAAEKSRGPRRRIAGVIIDWTAVEALYGAAGLPAVAQATASREAVPVFDDSGQVGRMTSSTWSPTLKKMVGLATLDAARAQAGTTLQVEYTVDAVRHRVPAIVAATPFFNPRRKVQTPP